MPGKEDMGSLEGDGFHNNLKLDLFPGLEKVLSPLFGPIGFQINPFQIQWYNELVGPKFQLDYPPNTIALVLLSGPDTFEKCVLPFVYVQKQNGNLDFCKSDDPLDESMKCVFAAAKHKLSEAEFDVDMFHDFDLHPNRRPKVLVQTASHVSGAAEYFHRDRLRVVPDSLKDSKLFGVAIHPEFGGWFAIRGVIVIKNLIPENPIPRPNPAMIIEDESQVASLLEEFTLRWRDNVWRDLLPRSGYLKYSQDFQQYLETEPGKRWEFVKTKFLS